MAATEPIRNKAYVKELAGYYQRKGNERNCLLILLGLHTALRISDLLRLTWEQVYDFEAKRPLQEIHLTEKKTGKPKVVAMNKRLLRAVRRCARAAAKRGGFLIENPKTGRAISRIQAYRIIRQAAQALKIGRVSCHSLRKTFGYHAWKSGVSPAILMEIYNHSSLAITRRYLGVTQDDKNQVYLALSY